MAPNNRFHEQDELIQKHIIDLCALALYGNDQPITRAAIHNAFDVDDLLFINNGYPLMYHLFLGDMDGLPHLGKDQLLHIHQSLDDNETLFDWLINHDPRVVSIPNAGWVVAKDNSVLIKERQHYDDDIPF